MTRASTSPTRTLLPISIPDGILFTTTTTLQTSATHTEQLALALSSLLLLVGASSESHRAAGLFHCGPPGRFWSGDLRRRSIGRLNAVTLSLALGTCHQTTLCL